MLKVYNIGGHLFQYSEGEQPENAVEVQRTAETVRNAEKTEENGTACEQNTGGEEKSDQNNMGI